MKRVYKKIEHQPFMRGAFFLIPPFCMICALLLPLQSPIIRQKPPSKCTVMCYMNGDNDLNDEVLHAVDMMETVGSSEQLNILALVDGGQNSRHGYGKIWDTARLLHIMKDDHIGVINSPVLEELGELDLGHPQTLERFIESCLEFPAERYVFCTFAHGQGIIETGALEIPNGHKSLAISPDLSSNRLMTHQEFHDGIKKAMGRRKFDLMVFFSCLTNMVEVGYALKDVTTYMVGSEDVIRIVNDPPGSFQIRGIRFEDLLREFRSNPDIPTIELGKKGVDAFIAQYQNTIAIPDFEGKPRAMRYSGGLSLVRCDNYEKLAGRLDGLARVVCRQMMHADESHVKRILTAMHGAMASSQRYQSFLNLEYYDLQDFLIRLQDLATDRQVKRTCREILDVVKDHVVIYERHTPDSRSHGISIYISNFLVPDNVYDAHQTMYSASRFGQDTYWDEMIDLFRRKMAEFYPDILMDRCQEALRDSDFLSFCDTHPKIPGALRKSIVQGHWRPVTRYLNLIDTLQTKQRPINALVSLRDFLSTLGAHDHRALEAIRRLDGMPDL